MPNKIRGFVVDRAFDRVLMVQVRLNPWDPEAIAANQGKRAPVILKNVLHEIPGTTTWPSFPYVIVCDEDSHLEFLITSKGPAGFGFKIWNDKELINTGYFVNEGSGEATTGNIRSYDDGTKTIQISGHKAIQHEGRDDLFRRQHVHITTWRMLSYQKNDKTYGAARGEVQVDVRPGFGHQGVASTATHDFASNIVEDDPATHSNGSLTLHFFLLHDANTKFEDVIDMRPEPSAKHMELD